jgi:3',5'-cyclic AMP phosphodiesterase CpdA
MAFNGDVQSCRGFTWYTDKNCASHLLLAEAGRNNNDFKTARLYSGTSFPMKRYAGSQASKKTVTVHRLNLTDLKADTTYVYKVGDAARGIWSQTGSFHTNGREDQLQCIIVADGQVAEDQDYLRNARGLQKAFETMPEADFLIHMGDFVESYSSGVDSFENFAQWQGFFTATQEQIMHTTILPVAGNHDMTSHVFASQFALDQMVPADADRETGVYYSVNYANACFIVLNTNEGYQHGNGRISGKQIEWLKNTAVQADKQGMKWKILLMHRAIYSFGRHMDSEDITALRAQLAPLISDLGIDLVLQGHDHVYMRSKVLAGLPSGEIVPQEGGQVIREDFLGEALDFAVDPSGTTYIIPNLIGSQFGFRKTSTAAEVYPAAVYEPDDNHEPVFAGISIEGDRLVYRAYAYDREGSGKVKEIDRYGILKTFKEAAYEEMSVSQTGKFMDRLKKTVGWKFMSFFWPLPRLYYFNW